MSELAIGKGVCPWQEHGGVGWLQASSWQARSGGPRPAAHTEKDLLTPAADPDAVVDEILALLSAERYCEVVSMSESLVELTEKIRRMNLPHAALVHYIE